MSITYSGSFTRSAGLISAITKQVKLLNLKPVKRIQVQFDPFQKKAKTARDFLVHICTPKVLETNYNCIIKPIVVNDRSEPHVRLELADGSIKFLLNNLSVLEVLTLINKHVSSKVPVEQPTVETKISKKKRK